MLFLLTLCAHAVIAGEITQPAPDKRPETETAGASELFPLWDPEVPLPKIKELAPLDNVEFSVIKPYEFKKDGYRFLHGIALIRHKGQLFASFGRNKGGENTDTEEAHYRISTDGGKTWGPVGLIDSGGSGVAVSHGQFLSHKGTLWAFHASYRGIMKDLHMKAYTFDEKNGKWIPRGVVSRNNFWSSQNPVKMENGSWIMAGFITAGGNPAAVSISHGNDFTRWDVVVIPKPAGRMWGESSVIVEGRHIINIARYGETRCAVVSVSDDYGRSWKQSKRSNLPMDNTKLYCGTLSTGQHYLLGTTHAECSNSRSPLTIAVTHVGEKRFSKIFMIRPSVFPEGPGESHPKACLAYPHAVEHNGKLYVAYSNNGGNVGRVGKGRELWNNNSAELAIIPVKELGHR